MFYHLYHTSCSAKYGSVLKTALKKKSIKKHQIYRRKAEKHCSYNFTCNRCPKVIQNNINLISTQVLCCIPSVLPSPPREGVRMQTFVLHVACIQLDFQKPCKNAVAVCPTFCMPVISTLDTAQVMQANSFA